MLHYQGYNESVVKTVKELIDAVSQHTCDEEFVKNQIIGLSSQLTDFRQLSPLSSLIINKTCNQKIRETIHNAFQQTKRVNYTNMYARTKMQIKKGFFNPFESLDTAPKMTIPEIKPLVIEPDEVDAILHAIQQRNVGKPISLSEPSISKKPTGARETVELMDYSKFISHKDTKGVENVQYISQLSCENLAKVVSLESSDYAENLKRMKAIALDIEADVSMLTVEEAEFILGEMGLLNSKIYEKGRRIAIERSVDEWIKRPIVVTIMGHVDHGKTTLLDRIQRTNIVKTEAGRITQKLGAFQVETAKGKITFVDTPGHAAFGAMRSRGIKCADVVILVISADDGIMPQTLEALDLIKKQDMPCIVAVNKIDVSTNEMKEAVRAEISKHLPDSPIVYISAKTGFNVNKVLGQIYETEKKLDAKTSPSSQGRAYVYESVQHPTRGKCLNMIVRDGTFKEGDFILCGHTYGRIRKMFDTSGEQITKTLPSQIVQVSWTQDIAASAGTFAIQCNSQAKANKLASLYLKRTQNTEESYDVTKQLNIDLIPEIKVVLRCCDQGGLDAVLQWIKTFNAEKRASADIEYLVERGYIKKDGNVQELLSLWNPICVVSKQIGPFNSNDIQIAETGQVSLLGFNVDLPSNVALPPIARTHKVIYHLFKDVEKMFKHYYGPTYSMKKEATLHVTRLGTTTLKGVGKKVAIGTVVKDGTVRMNLFFMLTRNGKIVAKDLTLSSMHSSKRSVTELEKGDGNNAILLNQDVDVRVGDELVAYSKEPLPPLFGSNIDCMLKV
ncbi:translation initiation factor IF-2, putative [Theileria equi strain WA]|uniref:Translation initiation factor IF-2, putative n=1 Tax=Theileria equi strain WA TaxID=1537102 RepID=L1LBJ7_THEEQ|nr:translation initiation factor IF-2, putative [Theileria equi strain WA]EKX72548.1 translation initiation factor IF-2, putative [Theileria equi strain WA]|eukprot:XP_004832000.1 translation initiation factor IF-2, putative [Theileria equi strain WA]